MPRLVLRPFGWSSVTCQRLTGPWKPLPVLIAATSMYCPFLKISSGVTVLPKSCLAYSSCCWIVAPPIWISCMSGFFRDRLVCWGCVAAITRIMFVLSMWSVIFWSICSVLKCSGITSARSRSFGGSFIHASVKCWSPYGVFAYVRMPIIRSGGVSITVAARMTSFPKLGLRFRSSIVKMYVMPALKPVKPKSLGVSAVIFGQ